MRLLCVVFGVLSASLALAKSNCHFERLLPAAPVAPPKPVTPPKPKPAPMPSPAPAQPDPGRRLPDRFPDRPVKPTTDPQNINPFGLYKDKSNARFLGQVPEPVRENWSRSFEEERTRLQAEAAKLGVTDPSQLMPKLFQNKYKLLEIEEKHRPEIEKLLRRMASEVYGEDATQFLEIRISNQLPAWPEIEKAPASSRLGQWFAQLKKRFSRKGRQQILSQKQDIEFLKYRRELYNMLSQAHGYYGVKRFYSMYEKELRALDPELPELLRNDLTLAMYGNSLMIQGMPQGHVPRFKNRQAMEGMVHGRNITEVAAERKQDEDGSTYLQMGHRRGTAVGHNSHDAAHETAKAGFKLATASEAVVRSTLTATERKVLDEATNTPLAEIRQGVFGPYLDVTLRKSIRALVHPNNSAQQLTDAQYLTVIDRVFSELPPAQFNLFIEKAADPGFAASPEAVAELRNTLGDFDLFPKP